MPQRHNRLAVPCEGDDRINVVGPLPALVMGLRCDAAFTRPVVRGRTASATQRGRFPWSCLA